MPRKIEKMELKRILQFEEQWLKKGDVKGLNKAYTNEKGVSSVQKATAQSVEHYLLCLGEDKNSLSTQMIFNINHEDMEDLRNRNLKDIEKEATQGRWKTEVGSAIEGAVYCARGHESNEISSYLEKLYLAVQQVGKSFGVDYLLYEERIYLLMIVDLALASNRKSRRVKIDTLHAFEHNLKTNKGNLWIHQKHYEYEKLSERFAQSMSKPLLSTLNNERIPVIGWIKQAYDNYNGVKNASNIAINCYKRRMISV